VTKLIVIFYSFAEFYFFSYATILAAIFGFSSVNLVTGLFRLTASTPSFGPKLKTLSASAVTTVSAADPCNNWAFVAIGESSERR